MRERMKARPQLESLESMTLLSGAAATASTLHAHSEVSIATAAPVTTLTLAGTELGSLHVHQSSSGKTYDITAAGTLTPIGPAITIGIVHMISGITSGPPNGTLQLITKKGTLKLQIPESVTLPPGLPTPTSTNEIVDTYVITKGTGAYKGDTGSGVVEFTFNRATSTGAKSSVGRADITFTTLVAPPSTTPTS
jgi:hypothetical protein